MLDSSEGDNMHLMADDDQEESAGALDPQEQLARYAHELADGIKAALPGWVERCVIERIEDWTGAPASAEIREAAARAGEKARDEVGDAVAQTLEVDIDQQRVPPLSLLRSAVRYPSRVLHDAGVPPVVRDEFAERNFPEDPYDLTPASFADLDPELHEPCILWGAAKAHVHLQRRKQDGSS
jgi:hypothetical protein